MTRASRACLRLANRVATSTQRYVYFGAVLLAITIFIVYAYYRNHPQVEMYPDSNGYIAFSGYIMRHGQLVDDLRLPGYPLLMSLIFTLRGRQDFAALSVVQGGMFVLATLEVYVLAALILRRRWIAFGMGLLVGTNIYLLKYIKPIISDGLALWLVITLALAAVIFTQFPRARTLWLVAILTLALFMTRPEWIYVPVPLVGSLLLVAARHGVLHRLLPHAVAAVAILYLVLGVYVYRNTVDHGYMGVTRVQSVNLLGKVLQYRMQDEAPRQYAAVVDAADAYVARGEVGPWALMAAVPALRAHDGALTGVYALAIVTRHPLEFVAKSIPVLFTSSSLGYVDDDFRVISSIRPDGPFAGLLFALRAISTGTYLTYIVFPLVATAWLILFLRRRASPPDRPSVAASEALGIVALLGLYALVMTTLGGYGDYARIHTSFDPLVIVVIWATPFVVVYIWRAHHRKDPAT